MVHFIPLGLIHSFIIFNITIPVQVQSYTLHHVSAAEQQIVITDTPFPADCHVSSVGQLSFMRSTPEG